MDKIIFTNSFFSTYYGSFKGKNGRNRYGWHPAQFKKRSQRTIF